MNILDSTIAFFSPKSALQRVQARRALAYYEAAKPSKQRKRRAENKSPNDLVGASAAALRAHARYLERNHDLSRGALRTLVNNIIGPQGITVEPQPRRVDGSIHLEYAAQLREIYRDWRKRPDVTHRYTDSLAQRLAAYTWLRDGECFAQQIFGDVPFLDHGTRVPFSIELFEPDYVPLDFTDDGRGIRQGISVNAWGRATAYHVYRGEPREGGIWYGGSDLKAIPASRMLHVATYDRLHQLRGVSEFASVITRVEDLKDYEESERIAAKVAASMTAYVKRNAGEAGFNPDDMPRDEQGNPRPRDLRMSPGMVIDTLAPGEEIGLIDGNRPNPNLVSWRAGQLRAFAAGLGASYSSISRDYSGTYSAQRQELVEQWIHYAVLTDEFVGMFVQPNWRRLVEVAHISGVVRVPADVLPGTENDALFIGQSMPWIDPLKETLAFEKQAQAGFTSEPEIIRRRGGNPRDTLDQMAAWREEVQKRGIVLSSNSATLKADQGTSRPDREDE